MKRALLIDTTTSQPEGVLLERELPKGGPEYSMRQMGCVEEVPVPPHLQTPV